MPPQRPMTGDERTTDATVRELAVRLLEELATSLRARGFRVAVEPRNWTLLAVNEAAEPSGPPDPLAVAFGSVKLTQRVTLALNARGHLYWHWQWSGPTRHDPPEFQPMCPAHAIADATERISRVLALAGR